MKDGQFSRRLLIWSAIFLTVPTAGTLFMPNMNLIWQLMVLVISAALFCGLGLRGTPNTDTRSNRLLFLVISAAFAIMALAWAVHLALRIYLSGSLGP